jgi:hypothetical protein
MEPTTAPPIPPTTAPTGPNAAPILAPVAAPLNTLYTDSLAASPPVDALELPPTRVNISPAPPIIPPATPIILGLVLGLYGCICIGSPDNFYGT